MVRFKRSIYLSVMFNLLAMLSIVLAQAAVDIFTLKRLSSGSTGFERQWVEGAALLGDIAYTAEAFRIAEVESALALGQPAREKAAAEVQARRREVGRDERLYKRLMAGSHPGELAAFDAAWAAYMADDAAWRNGPDNGEALHGGVLGTDYRKAAGVIDAQLVAREESGLQRASAEARMARRAIRLNIAASLLSVALSAITLAAAKRQVFAPLRAISRAMTRLAAGARDIAVPGRNRRDEIGEMAAACEVFRLNVLALDRAHEAARQAEEQAQLLARHDALTGLPNRRVFSADLETALVRAQKGQACYALLLIDLDDFKKVNDIQGHQAGDVVLCAVARRLEAAMRKQDTLARLGGDEFAIITQGGPDFYEHQDHTKRFAARLLGLIRQPIEVGETKAEVGASIGICLFQNGVGDVTSLLRAADIAMYRAKQSGRFTFRFFEQSMDDEMRAREALERDVAKAIADGSIKPHYQPLVDIGRGRIRGFEALARWTHPARGAVPPDEFIPIIEQLGLTGELSSAILRQACRDARNWPDDICVAVNISPFELKDEDFPVRITKILQEEGLAPNRLEVEITESALVSDLPAAKAILNALQANGVTISLDDFGTGYSSLYHLRELKFDKVKIDRSFVQAMRGNAESEKIIDAILGLTGSLHLPTVAEGIEDLPTLRMLTEKGCELGQGYYFGKAVPAEAVDALLARGLEVAPVA